MVRKETYCISEWLAKYTRRKAQVVDVPEPGIGQVTQSNDPGIRYVPNIPVLVANIHPRLMLSGFFCSSPTLPPGIITCEMPITEGSYIVERMSKFGKETVTHLVQ